MSLSPLEIKQAVVLETLVAGGLPCDEAAVWSGFTTAALRAIGIAHKRLCRPRQWADLQAAASPDQPFGEVDISVALFHEIDRIKDDAPLSSPLQAIEFAIEPPARDPKRRGPRSRRLDFRIKRRWGNGRTASLAVEVKLLRKRSDVKRAYLGADGIGCFLTTDSPYTRERVALMFAYSVADQHPTWAEHIVEAFKAGAHEATLHGIKARFNLALHSRVPRSALTLPDLSVLHAVYEFPPTIRDGEAERSDGSR